MHRLERLPPRTASLLLGLVTLCACLQSIITVVTGWYAMNLNNTHPQSYPAFYTVHRVLMRPDGQLRKTECCMLGSTSKGACTCAVLLRDDYVWSPPQVSCMCSAVAFGVAGDVHLRRTVHSFVPGVPLVSTALEGLRLGPHPLAIHMNQYLG